MGLGCKVHDGVNGLREEDVVDHVSTGYVSFDELEMWGGVGGEQVLEVRAVVELVEHNDPVTRVVSDQPVAYMGGNEPGCSCYQNVPWFVAACHVCTTSAKIDTKFCDEV